MPGSQSYLATSSCSCSQSFWSMPCRQGSSLAHPGSTDERALPTRLLQQVVHNPVRMQATDQSGDTQNVKHAQDSPPPEQRQMGAGQSSQTHSPLGCSRVTEPCSGLQARLKQWRRRYHMCSWVRGEACTRECAAEESCLTSKARLHSHLQTLRSDVPHVGLPFSHSCTEFTCASQ